MRTSIIPAEATAFERAYPGTASQPRCVRADLAAVADGCPAAESLLLLASELATNAILHSRSGHPERTSLAGTEVPALRRAAQPGDADMTAADLSKAREMLGYEPRVDLAEGLRSQWEWLADQERPAHPAAAGAAQ